MTRARASIVFLLLASVASVVPSQPARAQTQTPTPAQSQPTPAQSQRKVQISGNEVSVVADHFEQIGADNLLVATGNVEVTRGTGRLLADRVEINRESGDAVAVGRAIFYDGDDRLTGQRIEYNIKTGTGVIYQGEVHAAPYYRLTGERLERVGDSVYQVRHGVFTTCEDEPPSWSFHLGDGTADLEDFVYGWHVSFWVKSIPVIPYFPFFAGAIRKERQSGFLPPQFGSSAKKGFFAEIPFFWAISDSQDATGTFDSYEQRGFGGQLEYRYVISQDQRGKLNGFFVDEVFKEGELRGFGSIKHEWQIAPGLSLRGDLNAVSDDLVLRDYETSLQTRAAQRAESNLFLTKTWPNWNFLSRLYWYQDLTTGRPIELQRVPELTLTGVRQNVPGAPGALYQVDTSFVEFFRWVGSEGARFDLHPVVLRPVPIEGYATITPFVGGRVTAYSTTVTGVHAPVAGGPAIEDTNGEPRVRELLEYGADAESRASRVYEVGGWNGLDRILHTVEPRVHYIRIVGHNFYSLPLWTNQTDRIPEANWFEYSLTNRIRGRTVAPEGTEADRLDLFKFVVASAYDMENQIFGNVASELAIQPSKMLGFHSSASYNVVGQGLQAYTTDLALDIPRLVGSVGTRYSRTPQVIVPYFVQIPGTFNPGDSIPSNQATNFLQGAATVELWRNFLFGRVKTNWDIKSTSVVESRFGLDIRFDCWALSLDYVRRAPDRPGQNPDNEFRFSLNLLGLGNVLSTRLGAGGTDSNPGFR
jgi:LPS-assembly protein